MGMMRSNCVGLTHVEMVGWFSLGLVIFPKAELAGKRERLVTENSDQLETNLFNKDRKHYLGLGGIGKPAGISVRSRILRQGPCEIDIDCPPCRPGLRPICVNGACTCVP
ncbi:hypothetical protein K1719_024637 [Acacia pycnantha]|nr:hypothetical protein K1719_024637 [Acacia pycnantha]